MQELPCRSETQQVPRVWAPRFQAQRPAQRRHQRVLLQRAPERQVAVLAVVLLPLRLLQRLLLSQVRVP